MMKDHTNFLLKVVGSNLYLRLTANFVKYLRLDFVIFYKFGIKSACEPSILSSFKQALIPSGSK